MKSIVVIVALAAGILGLWVVVAIQPVSATPPETASVTERQTVETAALRVSAHSDPMSLSDAEWKRVLEPEAWRVLRHEGTERAFTGVWWDHHEKGVYRCAGCGQVLFRSDQKFDSGTGWPSFVAPATGEAVGTRSDTTLGMVRTEVHCDRCGGHLGHIFPDGPPPTGQRYCINSAALNFTEAETAK